MAVRADVYLTQYGHAPSRTRARGWIEAGGVCLDGRPIRRPSDEVDETVPHGVTVTENGRNPYVGRGGCKLAGALDAFSLDVADAWALDIGASTGGFTDCLLQRGAVRVYAVDAGVGQLAAPLLADGRVVNIEKCNARYLNAAMLDEAFLAHGGADIIVMDVSFISQTYILPVLPPLLRAGGKMITLVKPQFEVGREGLGKGGIVKDGAWRRAAVTRVLDGAQAVGLAPRGLIRSPIEGGDGNIEYLLLLEQAGDREQAFQLSPALFQ